MKKLSAYSKKEEHNEETPRRQMGIGRCSVYGCDRIGSILTSTWNCRYHHGKSGESLARITLAIRNHEAEINWNEKLLNFTHVDFDLGEVTKRAPHGLYVTQGEKWQEYKIRIGTHVEKLLRT